MLALKRQFVECWAQLQTSLWRLLSVDANLSAETSTSVPALLCEPEEALGTLRTSRSRLLRSVVKTVARFQWFVAGAQRRVGADIRSLVWTGGARHIPLVDFWRHLSTFGTNLSWFVTNGIFQRAAHKQFELSGQTSGFRNLAPII
jgi:hypothetical protein